VKDKTMITLLQFDEIPSPIGKVRIVVDNGKLAALDFEGFDTRMHKLLSKRYGAFQVNPAAQDAHGNGFLGYAFVKTPNPWGFSEAVSRYFAGEVEALAGLPVSTGGTAFQQACWQALRSVRVGTTATYAQQAQRMGSPKAVRAVGAANGQNPVALVIPCHRVKSAHSLTGYAGGLWRKEWLLRHEGALLA
jgi:methylated-DNA-[protein]-cysteine S-methyltransferase